MFDLLREIYHTATDDLELPPGWEAKLDAASRAYDELLPRLSPEARTLYDAWDVAQSNFMDLEIQTVFFRGVKLGLDLGRLS